MFQAPEALNREKFLDIEKTAFTICRMLVSPFGIDRRTITELDLDEYPSKSSEILKAAHSQILRQLFQKMGYCEGTIETTLHKCTSDVDPEISEEFAKVSMLFSEMKNPSIFQEISDNPLSRDQFLSWISKFEHSLVSLRKEFDVFASRHDATFAKFLSQLSTENIVIFPRNLCLIELLPRITKDLVASLTTIDAELNRDGLNLDQLVAYADLYNDDEVHYKLVRLWPKLLWGDPVAQVKSVLRRKFGKQFNDETLSDPAVLAAYEAIVVIESLVRLHKKSTALLTSEGMEETEFGWIMNNTHEEDEVIGTSGAHPALHFCLRAAKLCCEEYRRDFFRANVPKQASLEFLSDLIWEYCCYDDDEESEGKANEETGRLDFKQGTAPHIIDSFRLDLAAVSIRPFIPGQLAGEIFLTSSKCLAKSGQVELALSFLDFAKELIPTDANLFLFSGRFFKALSENPALLPTCNHVQLFQQAFSAMITRSTLIKFSDSKLCIEIEQYAYDLYRAEAQALFLKRQQVTGPIYTCSWMIRCYFGPFHDLDICLQVKEIKSYLTACTSTLHEIDECSTSSNLEVVDKIEEWCSVIQTSLADRSIDLSDICKMVSAELEVTLLTYYEDVMLHFEEQDDIDSNRRAKSEFHFLNYDKSDADMDALSNVLVDGMSLISLQNDAKDYSWHPQSEISKIILSRLLNIRGMLYYISGQVTRSLKSFELSIGLDSDCIDSYSKMSGVLGDLERFHDALSWLEAAEQRLELARLGGGIEEDILGLDGSARLWGGSGCAELNHADLLFQKGNLLTMANKIDEAKDCFIHCCYLAPTAMSESFLAMTILKSALAESSDQSQPYLLQKVTQASYGLGDSCKNYPDSIDALVLYGDSLVQSTNLSLALQMYEKASLLDKTCPIAFACAGRAYAAAYDHESAIKHFMKAREIDPNYTASLIDMGHCLMQAGKTCEALSVFDEALEKARYIPEICDALVNRAIAQVQSSLESCFD